MQIRFYCLLCIIIEKFLKRKRACFLNIKANPRFDSFPHTVKKKLFYDSRKFPVTSDWVPLLLIMGYSKQIFAGTLHSGSPSIPECLQYASPVLGSM